MGLTPRTYQPEARHLASPAFPNGVLPAVLSQDEDGEMRDFIVDEGEEEGDDDEEQAVGARKPAGRRRLALSDEDDE